MKHSPLMRITSAFVATLMAVCPFSMGGNLPTGSSVTHGTVGISSNGSAMQIDQLSGQAIVNWESFGIGAGYAVNVNQPDASAAMLSRVIGSDPSAIFGSLTANGTFYLVNPNGVTFGPNASVDVHSLIASTLDISDDDFLAGKLAFSGDSEAVITNDGALSAMATIALLAREVRNKGSIAAANVGIAAGQSVVIDEVAGGKIKLKLDRLAGPSAPSLASLDAGSLINSPGGEIVILSDNDTSFNAGAVIDAGDGFVEISGDDHVLLAGAVTAGALYVDPVDVDVATDDIQAAAINITASNNISIAAGITVQSTGDSVTLTADDDGDGAGSVTTGAGAVIDAFTTLTISGASVDLSNATVTAIGDIAISATDGSLALAALTGRKLTLDAGTDVTASGLLLAKNDADPVVGDIDITAGGNVTVADIQGDFGSDLIITATGDISAGAVSANTITIDGASFSASGSLQSTSSALIEANGGAVSLAGASTGDLTINGGAISSSGFVNTRGIVVTGTSGDFQDIDSTFNTLTINVSGAFSTTGLLGETVPISVSAGSVTAGQIHSGPSESADNTVDITATGDVSLAAVSGGVVTINGAAITSGNISAGGGDASITGTDISSGDLTSDTGHVVITATGDFTANTITAGDQFAATAASATIASVSAGAQVNITTTAGGLTSDAISAGSFINLTAASLANIASLNATSGLVNIDAAGITVSGATSAAGNVTLNGNAANVSVAAVTATDTLSISGADITASGALTSNAGSIDVTGATIGLAAVSAFIDIDVTGTGSVSTAALDGGGDIELVGTGITVGSSAEGSSVDFNAATGDLITAGIAADTTVSLAGAAITTGDIDAVNGIVVNGDSANLGHLTTSAGDVLVTATNAITFDAINSAAQIVLSGNGITERAPIERSAGGVQGGDIVIAGGAGDVSLSSVLGSDITITGKAVTGTTLTASSSAIDGIEITASDSVTVDSLISPSGLINVQAEGITVTGATSAGDTVTLNGGNQSVNLADVTGASVDIDSGAAISASGNIQSTVGDVHLQSLALVSFAGINAQTSATVIGDGMTGGDLVAGTSATLDGENGTVSLENVTANNGAIDIDGDEIFATGNLIATAGDVLIDAQVGVDIDGAIDAAGTVDINSSGTIDLVDVTADTADGDGDAINIAGGDIHATGTLTATTGSVDLSGDSIAVDTGIDSADQIAVLASGNITGLIVQAQGDVQLDSTSGTIILANGGWIDTPGNVTLLSDAGINIGGAIGMSAPINNLTIAPSNSVEPMVTVSGPIDANGSVTINGDNVIVFGITARDVNGNNRAIDIAADATLQLSGDLLTTGNGGGISLFAEDTITGMDHVINALGAVIIESNNDVDLGPQSVVNADSGITLRAATSITAGSLNAGLGGVGNIDISANPNDVVVTLHGPAVATGGAVKIAGDTVTVSDVRAQAAGAFVADRGIDIQTNTGFLTTGNLVTEAAGGDVFLFGVGAAIGSIDSVGNANATSAAALTAGAVTAALDIDIDSNDASTIASLAAGGSIDVDSASTDITGSVSSDTDNAGDEGITIDTDSGDLHVVGNISSNGGPITLTSADRVLLDDGAQVTAVDGAIAISANSDILLNSLVTSATITVSSATSGIYDNGDSHLDIDSPGTVTLSAPLHIGRVNAGDTLANPAGSTPDASDGNALDTQISTLIAVTTAADAEIAIDNRGVALVIGPGAAADLSPSARAKGALWLRNDLDLTVQNWQIDTDDDIALISTTGNVTIPGKAEVIDTALTEELSDADIVIGDGTARLEAAGNVLAGGGLSVIGGNLVLKSTTAPAIHTLVDRADIALDGPGAPLTLVQYNGPSGFAADLLIEDLDNDGNALITNGGVIDVTLTNGYDFVTDDGTLTISDDVSSHDANITFSVGSVNGQDDGLLHIANSAQIATDTSGDKLGTLAINGHVSSDGQLLANSGETLTLNSVAGQITITGPQAGAGDVTLDPGGNNEHDIIFTPAGRLEVNGGSLTIANVDTFGMQGSSRIDVRGGDVTVNDALTVHMSPDSSIAATGNVSIEASQEITLGHILSDSDGNGGNITVTNTFSNRRAPGDITISGVLNPGANDLTLSATGAILATGFGETVNVDLLTLSAATGIGSATSPIDNDALRIDADSTAGAIWLHNTPRADVTALEIATTGNIVYNQQGNNLAITGNGLSSTGGDITIDSPADITVAATIDTGDGSLTVFNTGTFTQNTGISISTGAGDTHIQSGGSVAIDAITTSDILIVSGGSIAETAADGGLEIDASGTISLIADGNIGLLHVDADTRIDAESQGTVTLETPGNFQLGHIAATDITLTAGSGIIDANAGDLNLVAPNATLAANGGSIAADSALVTITATASAAITLDESDDITLTSLTAAGDITVASDGSVTSDAITTGGNALTIDAENAITIGTAIANGAGDISLRAATGSVTNNASLAGAAIGIAAGDSVIVNGSIAGTGIVTLDADNLVDINATVDGAQIDITARDSGNAVTSDAAITASAGDVTINAPNGAILANSALTATGGGVRLSAETTAGVASITADAEVSVIADGTITTSAAISGADVTLESTTANLDLNGTVSATDSLTLLADTGIDALLALSGTTVSANAATITTHGSVSGTTDFTASGIITTNGNISGSDITIESTGANLDLNGTVIASDSLSLLAATGVDAADSLGGSRVSIQAATINTQSGADILTIGGDITLGASGTVTLTDVLQSTNDIIITSDATVTSTAAITASGDINIDAMGILLASAAASNDLYLDGTTGVTTTGNLSATSDLTVIGSTLSLGGTVTGGGQVTLIGTGGDLTLVNTVTGGGIEIDATGTATVDALSSTGDIHIQAGTDVGLEDSVSAANLIISAGADIKQNDSFTITTTGQAWLNAGGDVVQVNDAVLAAGDDIRIDAGGDVHVSLLATTGDDVRIEAGGHVFDVHTTSSTLNIDAPTATLTIRALSIGDEEHGGQDDLDVDVARLDAVASGTSGDDDLDIDDINTLIVERAESADGELNLEAVDLIIVGPVTAGDAQSDNEDLVLHAYNDLTIAGGTLTADDDLALFAFDDIIMTSGRLVSGDIIDLRADFDFDSGTDDNGNGDISQTGGTIGSGSESFFAYAADGILISAANVPSAQLWNGSPIAPSTASGDVIFHNHGVNLSLNNTVGGGGPAVANVAGDILIRNDANIDITHNIEGADDISILASGNIALANPATIVSDSVGNIHIDTGGTLTLASSTMVNANSGTIFAEAENDIVLSHLATTNATNAAVTVRSLSGSVTGDDTLVDILADSVFARTTITAATGIGTATDPLDTTVDTLNAHVTSFGGIWIDENTNLLIRDANTHNGNIVIGADLAMFAVDVIAGTSNIIGGNGDVLLTARGGEVMVDIVSAPLDTVSITASTFIEEDRLDSSPHDAAADIVGGTLNLVAGTYIGADANPIEIDGLLAVNASSSGNINLTDVIDDFPVGTIDAGSAIVTLLANDDQGGDDAAAIIDAADGNTDITAGTAVLTALNGIGVGRMGDSDDLDLNVGSLTATVTREGDINIDEGDSLTVTSAITADGDIAIRAVDSIAVGLIDGDQQRDNDVILWTGVNITDANLDTATDIFAGGLLDLTVGTGAIATSAEILEVIAGDKLHLTALDITPRGQFWAVLTGLAGGSDTPRYVTYTGGGDVPPARIFWNGDVIGGQEDQMLTYHETEAVFALYQAPSDDIAAFGPTTFLHSALLLDEYYSIRAIDFLHPGFGRVTLPDGTDIIDIQALVDDAVASPDSEATDAPEAEEAGDEETEEEGTAPKAKAEDDPAPAQTSSYVPAPVLK